MMRNYENDVARHRDLERVKKQEELDNDKRFLNALEYQQMLDRQKKLEEKMKLKEEVDHDLERSKQRKYMEGIQRVADVEKNKKLFTDYDNMLNGREKAYKDKLSAMNDRIYNNGMKHTDFMNNEAHHGIRNDPFYLKNDFNFNRRLAEMKEKEKDAMRHDPSKMAERMRMVNILFKNFSKKILMSLIVNRNTISLVIKTITELTLIIRIR
jgi:hypothetical protein